MPRGLELKSERGGRGGIVRGELLQGPVIRMLVEGFDTGRDIKQFRCT